MTGWVEGVDPIFWYLRVIYMIRNKETSYKCLCGEDNRASYKTPHSGKFLHTSICVAKVICIGIGKSQMMGRK